LSDKPASRGSYTLDAFRGDTAALLDALEFERVVLVGQSMGGGVALQFALRMPRRLTGLVLINPTGLAPIAYLPALLLAPREVVRALGRAVVPRWVIGFILRRIAYGNPSLVTERDVDEYWAPTQLRGMVHAARATLTEFKWAPLPADLLATLAVPSVVIVGRQDRLVRDAAPAERLPGARIHVINGGHCVHEEHPAEAYGIVAGFAKDAERYR
jgi:pimeloyl-ACP methyl ester carboxylesterase